LFVSRSAGNISKKSQVLAGFFWNIKGFEGLCIYKIFLGRLLVRLMYEAENCATATGPW